MRKLILYILFSASALSLCGCTAASVFSGDTHEYLISSLGFDQQDGAIILTAEAVAVNSEDTAEGKKRIILKGEGDNPKTAMADAKTTATQDFDLSHCGVIALGTSLNAENSEAIWDWCYNTEEITLSVYMIACENAAEVLEAEPISSVAAGYDIMSMQEKETKLRGTEFKNTLYETVAQREDAVSVFFMPFVSLKDEKRYIDGTAIFQNSGYTATLSDEDAFCYSVITDTFSGGSVMLHHELTEVKSAETVYKADDMGNIRLTVNVKANNATKEKIKESAESMISLSKSYYGDIFGLGNFIYYKKPELWQKIKDDYPKYYKNFEITVAVK